MQIKFYNLNDLSSKIINLKGGTLEETLQLAKETFTDLDIKNFEQNETVLKFDKFIADIIYFGVPKSEHQKGRVSRDWTEQIKMFNENYTDRMTAKALAVKSGLDLGQVYYIAKMLNVTLAKGQRGRKARK